MLEHSIRSYLNPRFLLPFIFREICTISIGLIVILFYLIIIFLCVPIYIYRYFLFKLTPNLSENLGKMVTTRGQFLAVDKFTSSERAPRSNIIVAMAVAGNIPMSEFMERFEQNLIEKKDEQGKLKYPELTQYVTSFGQYKYWKSDPTFKLSNHIRIHETNKTFTKEDGCNLIEVLLNQPFPPERSPWEILVVHDFKNEELSGDTMTLFLMKLHHCLTDGYGMLHTIIPGLSKELPVRPKPKYAQRGSLRLVLFKLTYPFRLLREISQFVMMSLRDNPFKVQDNQKAWKQLFENSPRVPIKVVKDIKSHFKVSFTSVLHSCLAAGVEKCLVKKYGTDKSKKLKNMPCIIFLPLPNHPQKLRNYCTGVMVHLPTSNMEPETRLKQCESDLVVVKKSTMPMLGKVLPLIGGGMTEKLAGLVGKNRSFPVSLSNFPVSEMPFDICGREVLNVYCAAGTAAGVAGLGFLIYSYRESVQIGVVGEQGIFSREDLHLIINGIIEEVEILHTRSMV